ncbi:amidase [Ilumatobacter nonamiensis]|uniref:amidase n=1 Tax=Ilumatobacter nonamiensis TaxID=467093 RepID=UPI0003457254|nr:amidase [Ilumatobacter nonamiensis]
MTSSIAQSTRWLDATAQAELVTSGEVSAIELVDAAIERIEAFDEPLNSVVIRWFDDARANAAEVDRRRSNGDELPTFAGVPTLLKDLWAHSTGHPMTNGNQALRSEMPISDHDTTLVARFRDAGLITLGRTNSPELGSLPVTEPLAFGPTRNPWSTDHTPGGSSGGAAAAVAAGLVPVANASDGGGSIRIPAACCGLIGLKPSQGRITMGPERDESGLSVAFAVTRSMRDTAAMLEATCGPGVGDNVIAPAPERPYIDEVGADPGRLRVGLLARHPLGAELDPECARAAQAGAALLEGLGHDVSEAHPSVLEDASFSNRFMAIWATNMSLSIQKLGATLGRELTEDEVEPVNWTMGQFAQHMSATEFAGALAAINEYRRAMQSWWADGWDVLVTPTLSQRPVRIGEHDARPDDPMAGMKRAGEFVSFTPPFNTSGQPAISLPLHVSDDGLPVGVQLVAAYGREDLLIRVASQIEAAGAFLLPTGESMAPTVGA